MTPARRSPDGMMAAVTASMQERTGRTLEEWVALVQQSGIDPLDQTAVRRWLKQEHGVLQNSQWAIADAAARAAGWMRPGLDEYIDQQYAGAKAELRPLFEAARSLLESLGDDVRVEGRQTYTSFVRARQFAAVQPASRTRIDVGLRFTDAPRSALLSEGRAPGQGTHRLSLAVGSQIGGDIRALFRAAYEQNG